MSPSMSASMPNLPRARWSSFDEALPSGGVTVRPRTMEGGLRTASRKSLPSIPGQQPRGGGGLLPCATSFEQEHERVMRPRHAEVRRLIESTERARTLAQRLETGRGDVAMRRFAMYQDRRVQMEAKLKSLRQRVNTLAEEKERRQLRTRERLDERSRQASDRRAATAAEHSARVSCTYKKRQPEPRVFAAPADH